MKKQNSRTSRLVLIAALLAVAGAACQEGATGPGAPTLALVAGDYDAAESFGALTFTTTADGATVDWLEAGAALVLDLRADGTVAGQLFIPGVEEDGGDLDADMAGTWTLSGSTVRFQQEADTFVRDMPFTYTDGSLSADRTFDGVRVRVVLVRR